MAERLYRTNGSISPNAPKELIMMRKYLFVDGTYSEARDGDIITLCGEWYVFFQGDLFQWKWSF